MANYDKSKRYTWSSDAKFEITGEEFGLILNALRSILDTEEAARILLAHRASMGVERVMEEYVKADIIKEVDEDNNLKIKR